MKRHGAIPYQLIQKMIEAGYIQNARTKNIQPSSMDLTITDEVYRLRGSYLPRKNEPLASIIERGSLFQHDIQRPLEQNGIYLIRLQETLTLPPGLRATTSNKSSSGRINLRARLLADGVSQFDNVPAGYNGTLWIEAISKSFPVLLHPGDRINQMRFYHGDAKLTPLELRMAYDQFGLLRAQDSQRIPATTDSVHLGITMTVDLTSRDVIGWCAKIPASSVLDTTKRDHDPEEFFDPVFKSNSQELVIRPEAFYILATKEKIITPPTFGAEMVAYDSSKGEFRSHFAGFLDPGFGWTNDDAARGRIAVMEIEAYSHNFVLRDGQPICLIMFEHLLAHPEKIYGDEQLSSHYRAQQGPQLAKWFKNQPQTAVADNSQQRTYR